MRSSRDLWRALLYQTHARMALCMLSETGQRCGRRRRHRKPFWQSSVLPVGICRYQSKSPVERLARRRTKGRRRERLDRLWRKSCSIFRQSVREDLISMSSLFRIPLEKLWTVIWSRSSSRSSQASSFSRSLVLAWSLSSLRQVLPVFRVQSHLGLWGVINTETKNLKNLVLELFGIVFVVLRFLFFHLFRNINNERLQKKKTPFSTFSYHFLQKKVYGNSKNSFSMFSRRCFVFEKLPGNSLSIRFANKFCFSKMYRIWQNFGIQDRP